MNNYNVYYKKYGEPAKKPYSVEATSESWARSKFNRFNTGCEIIMVELIISRCFVENDPNIEDADRSFFEDKLGIAPELYFDTILYDVWNNPNELWETIKASDQIWLSTWFSQGTNSGDLLFKMLTMAIHWGLKNKTIVNMEEYKQVAWHLTDECKALINQLKENNVVFVYRDSYEFKKLITQDK